MAPVQVALLLLHVRRHRGQPYNEPVQPRPRLPLRSFVGWAFLVVALAAVSFKITKPIDGLLESTVFSWGPDNWKVDLGIHGGFSQQALVWTAVLLLVGTVIVAPVVEPVATETCWAA